MLLEMNVIAQLEQFQHLLSPRQLHYLPKLTTETQSETVTILGVSTTQTQVTSTFLTTNIPATFTITTVIQSTTTPATSTLTAITTSSTGFANCFSYRLVSFISSVPRTK